MITNRKISISGFVNNPSDTIEFSSNRYKSIKFVLKVPFGISKLFRLFPKYFHCFLNAVYFY